MKFRKVATDFSLWEELPEEERGERKCNWCMQSDEEGGEVPRGKKRGRPVEEDGGEEPLAPSKGDQAGCEESERTRQPWEREPS